MNTAGKMQSMSGPSIFTGASAASLSARSNRRERSCSDWMRRIAPMETPSSSAWTSAYATDLRSPWPTRAAMLRRASLRDEPTWISFVIRSSSSLSGSSRRDLQLRWSALMKSMPASTESVSRSRTNGRARWIERWRRLRAP